MVVAKWLSQEFVVARKLLAWVEVVIPEDEVVVLLITNSQKNNLGTKHMTDICNICSNSI